LIINECTRCGFKSETYRGFYCPYCGGLMHPLHGFDFTIDKDGVGLWKFSPILPEPVNRISLGEGFTPLIKSTRLFREIVFFKDEGRNPTGSFRDRAGALIVSDALDLSTKRIILASDGNMGASIAAYAARAGIPVTVYVPSWIDPEKIMLMRAYGANVIIQDRDLADLLDYVDRRAREEGFYNASSIHNVLSMEGLKTISIEVFQQLGRNPKTIIVPLGSGLTLISLYHGFTELLKTGLINNIPKLIGVETCGNPLYSSVLKNTSKCGEEPLPGLSYRRTIIYEDVIDVIEKYGDIVVVKRRDVIEAAKKLSFSEGLFVEPSSAVALAGALSIGLDDYTVILLTGHGLKGPGPYTRITHRRSTVIFPSSTKYMILKILKETPGLTGYEVWKRLGLKITPQAVYQHLRELRDQGYVKLIVVNGVKKYYPVE